MRNLKVNSVLSYLLIAVGSLQLIGAGVQNPIIRGLGFATAAAPLPLVFSTFRGIENFAADFYLDLEFTNGDRIQTPMTSTLYSRLKGPYNRRNPYGAVIAYGPIMDQIHEIQMRNSILSYGVCDQGPLAAELGFTQEIRSAHIQFVTRTASLKGKSWEFRIECPL